MMNDLIYKNPLPKFVPIREIGVRTFINYYFIRADSDLLLGKCVPAYCPVCRWSRQAYLQSVPYFSAICQNETLSFFIAIK